MDFFKFPDDFIWGAATSSYQIEGAVIEDGKGQSTWDVFCKRPGKIKNNDTGDRACDHYHRYKEDVALMKELGVKSYRFSVSWPRILPEGEGKINQKGMDFYNRLVDELLNTGIIPFVTLFHWDLPQVLEMRYGGWRSKTTSKLFADYAAIVAQELSDRVKYFSTVNEIDCFTLAAHKSTSNENHAPGKTEPDKTVNQIVHNALLGHGLSTQALRANCPADVKVGFADNPKFPVPVYETNEHIDAAKKAYIEMNSQILFPIMTGKYDDIYLGREKDNLPEYTDDELKIISSPVDFIGYNYYQSPIVRSSDEAKGYEIIPPPATYPKTHIGWAITPLGLYYCLKFHRDFFGDLPVFITENGCSANDVETVKGEVLDTDRIEYLRSHLISLNLAIKSGINVKGYYVWSLMDNFEWAKGYSERFGIVRTNFSSMARAIKLSGQYYEKIIKNNCII